MSDLKNTGYVQILADLKEKIREAHQRAAVKVNTELLALYWEIGNTILEQQAQLGWGAKVIKQLSSDLKEEFPEIKGFSERNLKYMRAFAEAYSDFSIVQAPLAQIENSNSKPMVQAPLAQLSWSANSSFAQQAVAQFGQQLVDFLFHRSRLNLVRQ
jgi:hypothetical protein